MSGAYNDFLKKQAPLCTESPFNDTLSKLSFNAKHKLIERSWKDYDADLVSGGCPKSHLCRGGSVCFGRPLPDYSELTEDIKRIPNVKKGQYLGKDCLLVYPTFCTTITQFGERAVCPFASTCTTQCATMSSRLELEESFESIGDEHGMVYSDQLDYSEMRYEHVDKPTEQRSDICWFGIRDRAKKIVEYYDLWAYDFNEIAEKLGEENSGNVVRSYRSSIKKLKRNTRVLRSALIVKKRTYLAVSQHSGVDWHTAKSILDWAWLNCESFRLRMSGLTGGSGRPDAPNPFTVSVDGGGDDQTDATRSSE